MKNSTLAMTTLMAFVSIAWLQAQGQPTPPSNVRVVSGNGARVTLPPESYPAAPCTAPCSQHAYFNALSTHPQYYRGWHLRSQAQLDAYAQKSEGSTSITYNYPADPDARRQDAAKVTIPADLNSIPTQVRLPIEVTNGSILVTWDAWFGREFNFLQTGISTMKTFQFASPKEGIWCEVRSRFSLANAPALATVDSRGYVGGPRTYAESFGPNVTNELPLTPVVGQFTLYPERWTRYWALFERAGDWDLYTLWVADEHNNAVKLHDRLQLKFRENHLGAFWLEYNTSAAGARTNGPLVSYVRNVVMLRNVPNPEALLQRPVN